MRNQDLFILGEEANILSRQAIELAGLLGYLSITVTDDVPETGELFLTLEDKTLCERLLNEIDQDRIINLIHPSASVSPSANLGRNVFVGAQAIIGMNATIGDGVTLNALSSIEHDNNVGAFTFLGTGAILCGRIETGPGVFIGGGATIKPGTKIGARTTIGTGAVLVKDADADSVYIGNPARKLERR